MQRQVKSDQASSKSFAGVQIDAGEQIAESAVTERPINIILFSTLYPNSLKQGHGIFVETRLLELIKSGAVVAKVVAPIPWFPGLSWISASHALWAKVPKAEQWHGVEVHHPRYFYLPKIGMSLAPLFLALGSWRVLRNFCKEKTQFALLDAHYAYPDGVAAAMLAAIFNVPFLITARGTDINVLPQFSGPRRWLEWALNRANALIGVSADLCRRMGELCTNKSQIHNFRNGVDLARFNIISKLEARNKLRMHNGKWMLSVAALRELKGQHLMLRALVDLPDWHLMIVGEGEERQRLESLARGLGVQSRVRFEGAQPQTALAQYYSAADVFVLASSREGWPNVLLESMACGTPVVATAVSGVPDMINSPDVGELMRDRTSKEIVRCVKELSRRQINCADVRRHATKFDWVETTKAQIELFRKIAKVQE